MLENARAGEFDGAGTIHFNGEKGSTTFDHDTVKNYFDILHDAPVFDLSYTETLKSQGFEIFKIENVIRR